MKNLLYFLMLLVLGTSCIASKETREERKIARFVKKYGHLLDRATRTDTVRVFLPPRELLGRAAVGQGVDELDLLIGHYTGIIDSLNSLPATTTGSEQEKRTTRRKTAKNELIKNIQDTPILPQPILFDSAGIVVNIWQEGRDLHYRVRVKADTVEKVVKSPVFNLPKPETKSRMEQLFETLGRTVALVLLGAVVVLAGRFLFNRFIKP